MNEIIILSFSYLTKKYLKNQFIELLIFHKLTIINKLKNYYLDIVKKCLTKCYNDSII